MEQIKQTNIGLLDLERRPSHSRPFILRSLQSLINLQQEHQAKRSTAIHPKWQVQPSKKYTTLQFVNPHKRKPTFVLHLRLFPLLQHEIIQKQEDQQLLQRLLRVPPGHEDHVPHSEQVMADGDHRVDWSKDDGEQGCEHR